MRVRLRRGGRGPDSGVAAPVRLGLSPSVGWDILVALAGNPNTGKSTVFNAFTGLRQHTGNWPGKTVTRMEGSFAHRGKRVKVVDLPGTYSLQAASVDEEIARDFVLFGRPDVVVVVVDATRLERNLNLVLQVLEITDRVVVALNLVDEAERHGIEIDADRLSRSLGVPVVPTVARDGRGIDELLDRVIDLSEGRIETKPHRIVEYPEVIEAALSELVTGLEGIFPRLDNARWVALRLLSGDEGVVEGVRSGQIGGHEVEPGTLGDDPGVLEALVRRAEVLRAGLPSEFDDLLMERIYTEAHQLAEDATVRRTGLRGLDFDRILDRILTSKWTGFPVMLLLLMVVFWITISGSNYPSELLSVLLIGKVHPFLLGLGDSLHFPWWLSGFLFDGVYLGTAWVVSVMLPPMAIFFPLFTLLEDFGYLPRVAFNLDAAFKRVGAHGKQALTMAMGFGCNVAGVVATRVIDSPRERLVAILTNNFSLCNGRWPTQILIATIFLGALVPAHLAGIVAASAVVGIALLGILFMFLTSWLLTRTILRGEASTFSLELPPYRPPRVLQTLYTSLIDRTLIVLWRAVIFAIPAGAAIWLISNIEFGGASLAEHLIRGLHPFGVLVGLNGVILLAYIVAIPANEVVIPTILMLTVLSTGLVDGAGAGVLFEPESAAEIEGLLAAGGWTLLTGVSVMLFSLLHNPCSTTLFTIYKETGSRRWTAVAALMPLALGFLVCFVVAQVWRLVV